VVLFLPEGLVSIKDVPKRIRAGVQAAREKRGGAKLKEKQEKKEKVTV